MAIITKLVNKLKMKNTTQTNPGNVYIPNDFEVEERKKDVDENQKWQSFFAVYFGFFLLKAYLTIKKEPGIT